MKLPACAAVALAALVFAAAAAAAPTAVTAWYMYGTSAVDLRSYAYAHGCHFAQAQPGSSIRVLLLDFGAARKLDSSTWGAVDFSNTRFSNADILAALERAADGYHNCHLRGGVDIAYGNSNYHLSASGMSGSDAAADLEPSWAGASTTRPLVDGNEAQGWALDYDFGSADGCPQSGSADGPCNNGWHVSDVGYVSFHGLALPLPEIYYQANARQWTVVRTQWSGDYFFEGVTSSGVGLSSGSAWSALDSLNSGLVDPELVCFGC